MALWKSINFQNILSPINYNLESLHDLIMVWLVVILLVVLFVSMNILTRSSFTALSYSSLTLEVIWTLIPMFILTGIALPSIYLLLIQDSFYSGPNLTVKLTSNQWNWQSEWSEVEDPVDHLLDEESIEKLGSFSSPVILTTNSIIRILLSSSDVLHSLGVPSMGIKLDSNPGRLNCVIVESSSFGMFQGSCYELCGSGHSAMPIFFKFI